MPIIPHVPLHSVSLNFNIHASARLSSTKKPERQTYPFSVPRNTIYLTSNTFHYSLHLPLNTSILMVRRNIVNTLNSVTHDILARYIKIEGRLSLWLGFDASDFMVSAPYSFSQTKPRKNVPRFNYGNKFSLPTANSSNLIVNNCTLDITNSNCSQYTYYFNS